LRRRRINSPISKVIVSESANPYNSECSCSFN